MNKHIIHGLAIAPTTVTVVGGLTPHFPIIIGFAISAVCLISAIVSYAHMLGFDSAVKAAKERPLSGGMS